jgi:hypothetical protein
VREAVLAWSLAAVLGSSYAFAAAPPGAAELMDGRGFRLHFTPRAAGLAAPLLEALERRREDIARRMGRDFEGAVDVYLADGPAEAHAIAPAGMVPPPWASGLALPSANALLFDARALRAEEGRQIVAHELAHLALGRLGSGAWPRWFQEGFAMLVAGEWSVSRYTALYRAAVRDASIPLEALAERWPERLSEVEIAYAQSASFVAYLHDAHGESKLRELIGRASSGDAFASAFAAVYGVALERAEADWRASLASRFRWLPVLATPRALWLFTTAVFLYAYLLVRRRRRERLAALELEEQAARAAARIVAAEQVRESAGETPGAPTLPKTYLN